MIDQEHTTKPSGKTEGPWVAHALKPGHAILEYVVERTLGGGGFGITYLARDEHLNLPVAVKEYLPTDLAIRAVDGSVQSLGDEFRESFAWGLERFLAEARVLANFHHPNIVRVLRYFPANGTAYIVMEFESGESLKKWGPSQNNFNQTSLLRLILPLLDGLEVIHKAGFLHRDIKPDNIYIRTDETPVLIDFGSARSTSSEQDMTSIVTPGFAPFEQYQSKGNQGPWTDLYSLAAVIYWLVSGHKPLSSIERMKQDSMVPAIQLANQEQIGEPLLSAIDWALSTEESLRPQTVSEFRKRLLALPGQKPAGDATELTSFATRVWELTTPSGKPVHGTENHGNVLVCSILFLDIVAYSKTSVNEQYQLKSNFNHLIGEKLAHISASTRIMLDTGDGAAICFMGDPEEVLYAAKEIQSTLHQQTHLNVRMGLHIGPVRILNDLNGQNNVIGDGINVAQRVMSFADSNCLVVSRAFYEIASCITDGAERAFSYLGERHDKHNRIHEIYAVIGDSEAEKNDERTIRLGSSTNADNSTIDPIIVTNIEKELTHHLGPLARILINKLKFRAHNEVELRKLLALSISNPLQREEFLQLKLSNSGRYNNLSASDKNAPNNKIETFVTEKIANPRVSMTSEIGASIRPWLSTESISILEKYLAKSIGPMARVLVKKEVRKAESLDELCKALSLHIDNLESRAKFIKDSASLTH